MYLKSITLKGFKSFPDRTRLEFGPGVSVIVGPNGSGKSNVTDAVLWALGEQSPVAVRGQSMQDVIFGGAPGRQAGKAAEVELVLDDSEGMLGLGSPEISIVRRLDRTGDGEYRLAGARCRLVDVIELLSDTGLGKEMHSVISQGRVESIVTSKPRDRRMLIEEAAGLGKHRKRRRRAQLKLGHTQDNLDRALDVEREARSRLRPLKRQAEAADLHARLERQTLETRWELSRDDLRAQREALAQAQQAAQEARSRAERVERELQQVSQRREAAEEKLALRSAHREELSRRLYVAQSAGERVSYRAEAVRAVSARIETALERSAGQLAALESQAQADVDDPETHSRIARLERELEALERDREAELARQIEDLKQQLAAASAAIDERAEEVERTLVQREQADSAVERAREAVRAAERGVEAARREAARVGGELAAVNQFLRAQTPLPGVATALADELEVDAGYELALAAALDGRLRAAVVGDRRDGADLLDRAGAEGGRALVASASDADPGASANPPVPGAERLADRLRGGDAAVRLARSLLRDTWLVESLDQVSEQFAGVAVTRAGRVWSGSTRELRQAPAVGEERVLAERNRRDQLVAASEAAAQAEQAAKTTLERAADDASQRDAEAERATAANRAAVRARDEAGEERRRIEAMIEHRRAAPDDGPDAGRRLALAAQLAAERDKLERVERERAERQTRLERARQAVTSTEALRPGVARVLESLAAATDAIAQRRAAFEEALAADRQAGEHVAAELKACAQQEATLHTQLHSENEARTETQVRLQRAGDRVADLERELAALATRLQLESSPAEQALEVQEREALSSRLERLMRRREQLGPVNPLAQQEYAEAVEHVEELERQRADLEDALRELEKLIADTDRQIRETFEQTFEAAARNFEQVAGQLFPGGSGRLRLVAEREGPARVLGGATPPNDDEDGSESDETVENDPVAEEDLLGVEIEITPAGKEMKRLTLLSGGEKSMTALAFLFAVFLARPCPFYILDEVEAALDDLNIDRFLELLRVYSSHAQFIVVTHQKRTMEAADSLYGVSMSGDGISKVISRRLAREEAAA
ncbi:MAG: chromosome segregation SMC family protein [Solirubrobacteraceae bacterium]